MAQRIQLGDLERRVMEFLWAHGPSTADQVRQSFLPDRALKDSTVRTVLRRLEAKRYVDHTTEGRQYVYRGVRERENVAVQAVRGIIETFCRGSVEQLLVGMVNGKLVGRKEIDRLTTILDNLERKGGKR
ncbi:MAG: BlaI/MecI/CopY family transcriptional regulator [Acidobacteria bacterium]|nr:BlaI/MecI/CopY family transcriptional regulator [Acidobacteriota bacterium]